MRYAQPALIRHLVNRSHDFKSSCLFSCLFYVQAHAIIESRGRETKTWRHRLRGEGSGLYIRPVYLIQETQQVWSDPETASSQHS